MLIARCAALSVLLFGASESKVGYGPVALDGDIGSVAPDPTAAQDVATGSGLGSQGRPSGRLAFEGDPVFAGSGSMFDADAGALAEDFGGSSFLGAGATVPDFEWSTEAPPAFDVSLGPVTSRGFAAAYFGPDLEANERSGLASEAVELEAPVPISPLRDALDLGVCSGAEEVGRTEVDDDLQAHLLDVETVLTVHATSLLDLFLGYRVVELGVDDLLDDGPFDPDVVRGLVIGGEFRF